MASRSKRTTTVAPTGFLLHHRQPLSVRLIGRAAIGNPWVFEEVSAAIDGRRFEPPTARERVSAMLEHVRLAVEFYGEMLGMISTRRMMAAYLKRMPNARDIRSKIMACEEFALLERMMNDYLEQIELDSAIDSPEIDGRAARGLKVNPQGAIMPMRSRT